MCRGFKSLLRYQNLVETGIFPRASSHLTLEPIRACLQFEGMTGQPEGVRVLAKFTVYDETMDERVGGARSATKWPNQVRDQGVLGFPMAMAPMLQMPNRDLASAS